MEYEVVTPLKLDGEKFEPGDIVDLPAKKARKMPWAVKRIKPKPAKPESKE